MIRELLSAKRGQVVKRALTAMGESVLMVSAGVIQPCFVLRIKSVVLECVVIP